MPYEVKKEGHIWLTVNADTGKVKGRHKTKKLAEAQMHLLYGVENGWIPTNYLVSSRQRSTRGMPRVGR